MAIGFKVRGREQQVVAQPQQQEQLRIPVSAPDLSNESILGITGRGLARTGARVAETVAGLPGDITSLAGSIANAVMPSSITTGAHDLIKKAFPSYGEVAEREKNQPIKLPTSSNLREVTQGLTGGYLDPQNRPEEFFDDAAQLVTSLAMPIPAITSGLSLGKSFLGGALGSIGGEIARQFGAEPGAQAIAKIGGTILGTTFGGRQALLKQQNSAYTAAQETLPKNAEVAIPSSLGETVNDLKKLYQQGTVTPTKEFLRKPYEDLSSAILNGKINVNNAWQFKRDFNELWRSPGVTPTAKRYLGKAADELGSVLRKYGKESKNTDFLNNFNKAEDIYKGLNNASTITKFLSKQSSLKSKITNPGLKEILFGTLLYKEGIKGAAKAIGAGYAARETSKLFDLITKSKEARMYYLKGMAGALKESPKIVAQNFSKLDKIANQEGFGQGSNISFKIRDQSADSNSPSHQQQNI